MKFENDKLKVSKNFGPYTKAIEDYLRYLLKNSVNDYKNLYYQHLQAHYNEARINNDLEVIYNSLSYTEEYMHYYYTFYNENFETVLNDIIRNIKSICVFPLSKRGLYGEFIKEEKRIEINPELPPNRLTSEERTRLYICHELGHITNSYWMEDAVNIINNFSKLDKDITKSNEIKQLVYDGFSLLDEALTQERAETIAYYYAGKQRVPIYSQRSRLFDGQNYFSNFDFYGELYEPAVHFSKTLKGIKKLSDREAIKELSIKSLDHSFANNIFDEYKNNPEYFYLLFEKLGIIKNAMYESFGIGNIRYLPQSKQAKEQIEMLTSKFNHKQKTR